MPNSLWPSISKFAVPAEGQIAEGGGPFPGDKAWNCVFAVVSVCLQVLGYQDIEPEDLRQIVQPGTHAGTSFEKVAAFLEAHPERWPNLPRIDTWNPADTLAAFDQMLAKGYLTAFDAWDDGNGNLLNHPPPQGFSHAMLLEAQGPTTTTAWNPWNGEQAGQTFDHAFIKGATSGGTGNLMVFARNIVPAAPVVVTPPAAIVPNEEDNMLFRSSEKGADGNPKVYVIDASGKRHLEGPEYAARVAAGAKLVDMSAADLAGIPDVPASRTGQVTGTLTVS